MHPIVVEQVAPINDPAQIARNAKASLRTLKEVLKAKDPWDRDVEFHRQNTRRLLLQLILSFPYAPQTQVLDNPMWIETSHAFIAIYRNRITVLERIVAERQDNVLNTGESSSATNPNSSNKSAPGVSSRKTDSGPVELRKLIQRFRQFLADEERFWISFILRFARSFALKEAQPHFASLNLTRHNVPAEDSARRTLFPEEGKPTPPPTGQREKKIMILVKALISLGDLARYREQYNESGGRPKAGHEDVPPRWATKPTRKPGDWNPRPRNYNRALAFYNQARLLFPDAGNASHQLAIVASYQSDTFGSVLHYYRSLCVRLPFHMALENLDKTLSKALDAHIKSGETLPPNNEDPPKIVVDRFKKEVSILHALWRADKKNQGLLNSHTDYVLQRFADLLCYRLLPIGLIVKIYVAAIGALWTLRMYRRSTKHKDQAQRESKDAKAARSEMETTVLAHVMELHYVLVDLATVHLQDAFDELDPHVTHAERISAILRRSLQTLRVAGRWLRANLDYLTRMVESAGDSSRLLTVMEKFWPRYAEMITLMKRVFPLDEVKTAHSSNIKLEEDVDLTGFTPMKGSLVSGTLGAGTGDGEALVGQAHPNEEFLMRIEHIELDVDVMTENGNTPLKLIDGIYVAGDVSTHLDTPPIVSHEKPNDTTKTGARRGSVEQVEMPPPTIESEEPEIDNDDITSVSTRTDDDPVAMAMKVSLDQGAVGLDDEEDEEDQILFNPGHISSPWTSMGSTLPTSRMRVESFPSSLYQSPQFVHQASPAQHRPVPLPIPPSLPLPRGDLYGTSTGNPYDIPLPGLALDIRNPIGSMTMSMSMGMGGPTNMWGSQASGPFHEGSIPPSLNSRSPHERTASFTQGYATVNTFHPGHISPGQSNSPYSRSSFSSIGVNPLIVPPTRHFPTLPQSQQSPIQPPTPTSGFLGTPRHRASSSAAVLPTSGPGGAKTAQDLLLRVLGGSGRTNSNDVGVIGSGLTGSNASSTVLVGPNARQSNAFGGANTTSVTQSHPSIWAP